MVQAPAFLGTTVGKKIVMAVTGLILVAFVIGHVAGNLLFFAGAEHINAYGAFLKSTGELLWGARIVLFASVCLHVWAATSLTLTAQAARPIGYQKRTPQVSTFASRTIRYGGFLLLVFIVFHILHFTTGTLRPAPFSETDIYANIVASFSIPWVAAFYIVSMAALGLHLFHGAWAAFRTLGAVRPNAYPLRRRIAAVVAIAVWLGFTAIPLAVITGLVK